MFRYPSADLDFKIFRMAEDGEEKKLLPDEKQAGMGRLWDVTLRAVDATIL